MRLQIAITAICSLKICQIALNESVKDRKIANVFISENYFSIRALFPSDAQSLTSYACSPKYAGIKRKGLCDRGLCAKVVAQVPGGGVLLINMPHGACMLSCPDNLLYLHDFRNKFNILSYYGIFDK